MNPSFSFYALANFPQGTETNLATFLDGIRSGTWAARVAQVRAAYSSGGKEAAKPFKNLLPAVTLSGTFSQRKESGLIAHSGLICADLDTLGGDLAHVRETLRSDSRTVALFLSPSGDGLKVVFRCDLARPHKQAFNAAKAHVHALTGVAIDEACKDVSRLCYVSHDPDAYLAPDVAGVPVLDYALGTMEGFGNVAQETSDTDGDAGDPETINRARAYLTNLPAAISGQHGHAATFKAALVLAWGFGLNDETALPLLEEYNTRCVPPWSDDELRHKLESARQDVADKPPFRWLRPIAGAPIEAAGFNTDIDAAARFAAVHADIRYVRLTGFWLRFLSRSRLSPPTDFMGYWIAVDLDGTLAETTPGPYDPVRIGPPVRPMLDRVRAWLAEGRDVRIFTARANQPEAVAAIRVWLDSHGLDQITDVTDRKDRWTAEIWDDRAVSVVRNLGVPATEPVTNFMASLPTRVTARLRKPVAVSPAAFASGAPRRDPNTGAFTAAATVSAKSLRKAWSVPAARIRPRAKVAPRQGQKLSQFSAVPLPLSNQRVDTNNAIIEGVSVMTSGIEARGHGLEVDLETLRQVKECALEKGKVPVTINHGGGADAVCGYLDNFRLAGAKLLADWHLLKSHPRREQILETAQVMPEGLGLSASFLMPDGAEPGKARCSELFSVDLVSNPAANPDGLFSSRIPQDDAAPPKKSAIARIGRGLKNTAKAAGILAVGAGGGIIPARAVLPASTARVRPAHR